MANDNSLELRVRVGSRRLCPFIYNSFRLFNSHALIMNTGLIGYCFKICSYLACFLSATVILRNYINYKTMTNITWIVIRKS
jgi:hypothetical protein